MTAAYFEDHPTDPDKVIFRKPPLDQGPDYERGFVDGMLYQTQSSVYKAVNRLSQPEQEPVLWMMPDGKTADKWALQFYGGQKGKPLYTTPPQRTWVGLTDEERKEIWWSCEQQTPTTFVKAIEQALKEKNV